MISLKKLLATALSAAMVLGTMAIPAFADESTSGNAAKIGGTEYATLTEAVDAAQNGDTVTLLNNSEGVGLTLSQKAPKNIVIDFNNYTYTVSNAVGSTTYETQAAHFEKGNTVTLKNGTLAAGTDPNLKLLIQNYCDLTLENMTLDGGDSLDYILSINHGNVVFNNVNIEKTGKITTIDVMHWENVKYTVGSETDTDYYKKSPTLKIYNSTNNIINGNFDIYCYDALTKKTDYTKDCIPNVEIYGGTFTADVSKYATANRTVMRNPDGTYTVSVAKIGDQGYSTLKDAVDAAKENETVTLLDDVTINPKGDGKGLVPQITIDKSVTLDLAGHKIAYDASVANQNPSYTPAFFVVCNNADVTITGDGTIDCEAGNNGAYGINVNGGNLTIENGTFYGAITVAQVQEGSLNVKGGYYDLAPSAKSQHPEYAKYIINAIDSAFKDGSAIISVTGGTFVNFDPSANPEGIDTSYVAKGYYSKDNQNGTFSVLQSAAKVIDNAKSAGVKVTLDNLEKHSAIDKTADATYNVVLDTVKPEDKAAVDEIKNANPNKTVIAYDIYVAKTENGVTTEVENLENQKLTLSLPTAVKEGSGITVYHNTDVVQNVTLSADRKSVSFIAPSFSTYTFVYDAANLTADDITKNIKVEFEQVTDSEYDIVLKATDSGKKINGLLTADLTFSLAQGTTGLVNYEITPAANMSLLVNGNRYTFSFDGTNAHSATGDEIVIGKVKFNGYCTGANFEVDTTSVDAVNKLHTTEAIDSIVDEYLTNGDGTNTGKLDAAASIDDIKLTQETANLTVNVSFPNAIKDNAADYQDMKVTVSGNGANEVVKLGNGVTFNNDTYTVEFTDKLVKGNTYTVTVEGAGYRTARYTVSMTGAKTLNFWNNVKDTPMVIEEGSTGTGVNSNFLAGDIVKDGQINIYDLSAVISYFGTDNLVAAHSTYAKYDLNRDGVIDSKDVAYVLVSWGK